MLRHRGLGVRTASSVSSGYFLRLHNYWIDVLKSPQDTDCDIHLAAVFWSAHPTCAGSRESQSRVVPVPTQFLLRLERFSMCPDGNTVVSSATNPTAASMEKVNTVRTGQV